MDQVALVGGYVLAPSTNWEARPRTIGLAEGKIDTIEDPSAPIQRDVRVVEATGMYVLPGLIDLHCHLTFRRTVGPLWQLLAEGPALNAIRGVRNALTVLRQGITTIRELAAPDDVNTHLAEAVRRGLMPGPRIVSAGTPLGVTGGHAQTLTRSIDGANEFRRATRQLLASGASWIKLIGSNDPTETAMSTGEWSHGEVEQDEVEATVNTAHAWGARVAAHAMGSKQLLMVARAGVDTIEHGIYLSEEGAATMAGNDVALVPTLSGYLESTWPRWQRGEDWIRRHEHLIRPHRQAFQCAQAAGVTIAVGTDSAGEIVHELQLMAEYGFDATACLNAATHINARVLGLDSYIGDLRPGFQADLLVVRSDPLDDLSALREVEYVVQAGHVSHPLDIRLPSGDEAEVSEPWFQLNDAANE